MGLGRGPTNDSEGFSLFLLISNVLIRNRESNRFSWCNCGLFQDIVGSVIYTAKINNLKGPTDYFTTRFLLFSNEG